MCTPSMHKLRLQDSTSYNCYPQLLLHLIQLRRQLLDEWIEQQPVVQRLLPDDMVDHAQCLEIMSKEIKATFQKLIKSWTLLAHLCDPMHVDKYRVERAAHGSLIFDDNADIHSKLPSSLDDPKLHRTLMYLSCRAYKTLIEEMWPGVENTSKRSAARRELDDYLDKSGKFSMDVNRGFWEDGLVDEWAMPRVEREVPLWQLWARDDINAPRLQAIMVRAANTFGAQSAVERANGLIELTSRQKRRNALGFKRRISTAFVAQKFRRMHAGVKERLAGKKSSTWAKLMAVEDGDGEWSDQGEYEELSDYDHAGDVAEVGNEDDVGSFASSPSINSHSSSDGEN